MLQRRSTLRESFGLSMLQKESAHELSNANLEKLKPCQRHHVCGTTLHILILDPVSNSRAVSWSVSIFE